MSHHTLYLCYFGLREPLVQTQVLPYLREIKKIDGLKVSLLTFEPNFREKWNDAEIAAEKQKLGAEDINWYVLPYHKSPSVPATLYDIFSGARLTQKLIREKNIDVLHARVHVPALMGAIAKKLSRRDVKLIFDIRGFFPEEYTDAGNWKENGLLYKTVKRIEKWLLKNADAFVVLTEKAREILFPESKETGFDKFGRPVEVIPCCVDLDKFEMADKQARNVIRSKYNLENRYVITYVGSLGTWYLADDMANFMQTARAENDSTFALILTQSAPEIMKEKLLARGFTEKDFLIQKVPHAEIPAFLSASDAALSFIKACYSKQSSSPTKIAEYLASGVPVITNRGVGDVAEQIEADEVGAVVESFNAEGFRKALLQIDKLKQTADSADSCRRSAVERFGLEKVGGKKYRRLYQKLLENKQQISDRNI